MTWSDLLDAELGLVGIIILVVFGLVILAMAAAWPLE
jgi:hypothetical protein